MQSLEVLVEQIDDLVSGIAVAQEHRRDAIAKCHPNNTEGAVNLTHYVDLRAHDLRDLQDDLTDIGVTSLATAEACVRAKLDAARSALLALSGDPGPWNLQALGEALDHGEDLLVAHAEALLGPPPQTRSSRIMVTLPTQAATEPDLVASLVGAGIDLARINCAHDGPDEWAAMAANVQTAAAAAGRTVGIYVDLAGPKLRTGPIQDGPAVVRIRPERDRLGRPIRPGQMWLTTDPASAPAGATAIEVDPAWLARRRVGETVDLVDTRRRSRAYQIVQVETTGVLATCERTSYLVPRMRLAVGDDVTEVGHLEPTIQRLSVTVGELLVLTSDLSPADPTIRPATIGCTWPEVFGAVSVGDRVLFDDGLIEGTAEATGPDRIEVRITRAPARARLGAEKGINLPDTTVPTPAVTDADVAALAAVVGYADVIGVSFVRDPADVRSAIDLLTSHGADQVGLVLKIETRQGFENLPEILLEGLRWPRLGVMIARGDLMTEIGWEQMSEVPGQIMSLCEAAQVPVIWATQVLESLAKQGIPSRAELIDAAEAQRAECVMLNKGPYIIDAVRTLDAVLHRMRRVRRKSHTLMRRISDWA